MPAPVPGPGEILVKNLFLSFDPAMRGWMEDRPSYIPPVGIGEVMRGGAVGAGDRVARRGLSRRRARVGAVRLAGVRARGARPRDADRPPVRRSTWPLGVLGITGLTAYFGMLDLGQPKPGETVVVSGAAGATGSVAAQIAKIRARARSASRAARRSAPGCATQRGFDAAIDYKSEDVGARLSASCARTASTCSSTTSAARSSTRRSRASRCARASCCAAASPATTRRSRRPGPRNLMNLVRQRGRMEGLIVIDYAPRFAEGAAQLAAWVRAGELAHREDIQEGIENAPRTFLRLFSGENLGKQLLRVGEPEGDQR